MIDNKISSAEALIRVSCIPRPPGAPEPHRGLPAAQREGFIGREAERDGDPESAGRQLRLRRGSARAAEASRASGAGALAGGGSERWETAPEPGDPEEAHRSGGGPHVSPLTGERHGPSAGAAQRLRELGGAGGPPDERQVI